MDVDSGTDGLSIYLIGAFFWWWWGAAWTQRGSIRATCVPGMRVKQARHRQAGIVNWLIINVRLYIQVIQIVYLIGAFFWWCWGVAWTQRGSMRARHACQASLQASLHFNMDLISDWWKNVNNNNQCNKREKVHTFEKCLFLKYFYFFVLIGWKIQYGSWSWESIYDVHILT